MKNEVEIKDESAAKTFSAKPFSSFAVYDACRVGHDQKKKVQAHRLFMIRSYVLALTFVSLRILSEAIEHLNILFFIENQEVKDTTNERMSRVLPLLATELWIGWIPLLKENKRITK